MSIISAKVLRERLSSTQEDRFRLYVVPVLDADSQVRTGQGAIDIRLGTDFIITRRAQLTHIDPYSDDKKASAEKFQQYQEHITIGFGKHFILHPRQYAIGSTLEYVRFPVDLAGLVMGRSSWGRLGLVIAMATMVHPGYTGVITLELQNLGDAPISLYAGARIGQLVFYEVKGNEEITHKELYKGSKYIGAISAGFSRLYEDNERTKMIAFGERYSQASQFLL